MWGNVLERACAGSRTYRVRILYDLGNVYSRQKILSIGRMLQGLAQPGSAELRVSWSLLPARHHM